jgi:hypothetical protein
MLFFGLCHRVRYLDRDRVAKDLPPYLRVIEGHFVVIATEFPLFEDSPHLTLL